MSSVNLYKVHVSTYCSTDRAAFSERCNSANYAAHTKMADVIEKKYQ